MTGALDFLGLCEVRSNGVALRRRYTLAFDAAAVEDDSVRSRTRVRPRPSGSGLILSAEIGDTDWSADLVIPGETNYYLRFYDGTAAAGSWFGTSASFSTARTVCLTTAETELELEDLVIRGLRANPAVVRKDLINLGPRTISLAGGIDSDIDPETTLRVPYPIALPPAGAVELLWDAGHQRWLVLASGIAA